MAEISTQAVIDAVTLVLRAAYPEAIILDDIATQGIEAGAFIVKLVTAGQQRVVGSRYHCRPVFEVIYFSAGSTEECVAVADNLSMALGMVRTPGGDLLHGSGMEWRTEDHVLYFTVGYSHYVLRAAPKDIMETLGITEGGLYG